MMKKIWKWIALIFIIAGGLSLGGCESVTQRANSQNTWQRIKAKKEVVVGLDDTFVPFGFETKAGKITGYDIDLAKAVFKQYGIKVSFQPIDWSMNVTELRNGTIDLIWNGLTKNKQRAKNIAFSRTYLYNGQDLVTLKKSHINNYKDMTDKVLGTQTGSSEAINFDQFPNKLKKRVKNHTPILYDSFTDAFIDLNSQRINGLFIDSTYANYYIQHQPGGNQKYVTYQGSFPKSEMAVGIRKGDKELRQKVNAGLARLVKTGQFKKITEKWFGNKYDSPLLTNSKIK